MSHKMGRPKSENPMDIDLKVRVDQSTNRKLLEYCKKQNITRAEAIRRGISLLLHEIDSENS